MICDQLWTFIQDRLFTLPSQDGPHGPLFNPYRDAAPGLDAPDAARTRRQNLHSYLASFPRPPQTLVVGEAYGWRGGRFSGVPFTSEALLARRALPFSGAPTSLHHPPYAEATATIFWRVMRPYFPNFLAWNCLPLHPHRPGQPLSNRTPARAELATYLPLLAEWIALLQPRQVIAIGRSAQAALARLDIPAIPVRHPSHGGAQEFSSGIQCAGIQRALA